MTITADGPHAAFKPTQAADRQSNARSRGVRLSRHLQELLLHRRRPQRIAIHQVNQGAGVEKGDHQSRCSLSSASMAPRLLPAAAGGRSSNHSRQEGPAVTGWLRMSRYIGPARKAPSTTAMPRRLSSADRSTLRGCSPVTPVTVATPV